MKPLQEYLDLMSFLAPSLITAAAVTWAASPAGVLVILRRESLLALALPQVVAVGIAVGLRMHITPIVPAVVAVAISLGIVAWERSRNRGDALLPALYIAGLALSILLIVHSGAHLAELQNLFTGLDVAVAWSETAWAVPLLLLTLLPTFFLWRRWLLLAQAPGTAQIAGIRPARWHFLFLGTLSSIVLISTDVLGIVMVINMLFLPAVAALPWARRLPGAMVVATVVGLAALGGGFVLSTECEWPLSQSAAAAGLVLVAVSHIGWALRRAIHGVSVRSAPLKCLLIFALGYALAGFAACQSAGRRPTTALPTIITRAHHQGDVLTRHPARRAHEGAATATAPR